MSKENTKNFFIGKIDKAIEKSNHEKHIELIEKHINFTKTSDGLNSSIRCFYEHGRASGTFLQQLKMYAEEYKNNEINDIVDFILSKDKCDEEIESVYDFYEAVIQFVRQLKNNECVNSDIVKEKSLKDNLWTFLRNEHDLILLDSEVFEIIHLIDKFRSENQS